MLQVVADGLPAGKSGLLIVGEDRAVGSVSFSVYSQVGWWGGWRWGGWVVGTGISGCPDPKP